MKVLFQNHSSLLIESDGHYLLTDPWFEKPAFGSWLPSIPPYIQPSYLAALGSKLTILVSHGHDDHLDDKLLTVFPKDITIVTANFKAPSVRNRIKKIGFENVIEVGEDGLQVSEQFHISSYIVADVSHDDATYLIKSNNGAVVHANDNWFPFKSEHIENICKKVENFKRESVLLFSQTNSASGFPLTYTNYSEEEQVQILRGKVARMVEGGLKNAESLGLKKMFSYAGFASPYVKNENYHEVGIFPSAKNLRELIADFKINSSVQIEDLNPGDWIELPAGTINKAFATGYDETTLKQVTASFYENYNKIESCLSYKPMPANFVLNESLVEIFLTEFDKFVRFRVEKIDHNHAGIIGKSFSLIVQKENGVTSMHSLVFGQGLVNDTRDPEDHNKACYVHDYILHEVLVGEALFEDLYTGYNAKWSRNPSDVYNRDIIMMLVMFSYVYKNRLVKNILQNIE